MEASRAAPTRRHRKSLRLAPLRVAPAADPAFEQLYRRHAREVYQYALALLTNPADAEDVTQTTFLNAYRAYQRGERPRRPHNWLITIAHNVCRMRWRQASHRPREVPMEEAHEPAVLEQERPNLDEVLRALARLTFNQRSALVMRELEGRSYQEIASTLGLSMSAVEALIFRARRNLQLKRRALGVLTAAPLPGSLSSLVGAGGGAVTAGGAAIGTDLVLKAAALLAAGAVTAGVGYESVKTGPSPARAQAEAKHSPVQIRPPAAAPARARPRARAKAPAPLRDTVAERRAETPQPEPVAEAQVAAPAPQIESSTQELASTTTTAAAAVSVPVPAPAPVPPAPVNVPPATIPELPVKVETPLESPVLPLVPVK